jgi:hypothetical protein
MDVPVEIYPTRAICGKRNGTAAHKPFNRSAHSPMSDFPRPPHILLKSA